MRRAILIGIDGATFDILLPWSREGIMPNLGKAVEMGSHGDLESTVPPTTPPAWASCVTGKQPGKHGIYDFRESFLLDPQRPLVSSRSVKSTKIWHILNASGRKTAIMNVPITYPPEQVDGFMISGMMTPSQDSSYTHPKELKEEIIKQCGDYVVNIDIPQYDVELLDDALRFFKDITYSFQKRRDAFFYLLDEKEWDFFMVVFIIADRIQHLFWKYLFPGSSFYNLAHAPRIREEIFKCYSLLDDMIGRVLEKLDDSTDLFIMSDHGFGYTEKWFNVNRWLGDLGLLDLRTGEAMKKSLFVAAMSVGESKFVKQVFPNSLQSTIRNRIRRGRGTLNTDIGTTMNWSKTKAFFASIPAQGIFININSKPVEGIVDPGSEYDDLRRRLKEELLNLKDPETGEEVVDRVLFREEVYDGPHAKLAPDILFVAKDYAVLGRQLFGTHRWIETSENQANGFHRSNGIFLSIGKHIKRNHIVSGAHITDVMPTILYAMGETLPDDLDGRVLMDIFDKEYLDINSIRYESAPRFRTDDQDGAYSEKDSDAVRSRLAGLGYIE
ncbi:MAG: alkaline phosphatase family protein [Candidatus Glassbacteria bacterium]